METPTDVNQETKTTGAPAAALMDLDFDDSDPGPLHRWTLWRTVVSLCLLAVGLEAVPIIHGLYSGSVSTFMMHWAEIDASVAMVLIFLLVQVAWQQRPQRPKLWQEIAALWLLAVGLQTIVVAHYLWIGPLSELAIRLARISAVLTAVLTLLLLIIWQRHVQAKYKAERLSEIMVYAYPKLVYIWPIILLGYMLRLFAGWEWSSSSIVAWIYLGAMITVLLTACIDLDRIVALLWAGLVVIIALGYAVIRLYAGVTFLDDIGHWFARLSPPYPAQFCYTLSVLLTIPYLIMIIGVRINNRWFISHNQIEHRVFLGKDDTHARGAKRVRASYPDMLELLLLGSGTLTVYTAQGNHVIAQIKNIPLLIFRMGRIDRILEALEVSQRQIEDDTGEGEGDAGEAEGEGGADEDTAEQF